MEFTHYVAHNTGHGYVLDSFSLVAKVIEENEETVTIQRWQDFGRISAGLATFSRKYFEQYYTKVVPAH